MLTCDSVGYASKQNLPTELERPVTTATSEYVIDADRFQDRNGTQRKTR